MSGLGIFSYFETLVHVVKGNLGAGLFAMGDAFKNSGFIIAPPGILFIGGVCVYNQHLLVRVAKMVTELKKLDHDPTFPESIALAFACGPRPFARISRCIEKTVTTFIMITQFGFCVVYITIVSASLKTLVEGTVDEWSVRWYLLFTLPFVFLASLISTLKLLAPISAVALVFLLYGWAVQAGICIYDLPDPRKDRDFIAPLLQWPLFIGTVIFTFEGIALVLPLRGEMRKQELFDKVLGPLNVGILFCMIAYLTLGPLTYWKYGREVESPCTINLPSDPLAESVRGLVALGIMLSYPIQFYVPVKQILFEIRRRRGSFKRPLVAEIIIRSILVLCTYAVALTVPYVSLVVSLLGAVCSNVLALLFPALASFALRHRKSADNEPKFSSNPFRVLMDVISTVLSVLGMGFGCYVSIWDLYLAIKEDLGLA